MTATWRFETAVRKREGMYEAGEKDFWVGDFQNVEELADEHVDEQLEDAEEAEGREKREMLLWWEDGVASSLGDLLLLLRKGSRVGELKRCQTVRSMKPMITE